MKRSGGRAVGRSVVLLLMGVVTMVGCTLTPPIGFVARDAYLFEAKGGGTAAGYLVLFNGTSTPVTLDSITSSAAASVTAHATRESNGLVTMIPLEHPVIAPHDSLVFTPGGSHLMLEGVTRDLNAGDHIMLSIWFSRGWTSIPATVRPYGS